MWEKSKHHPVVFGNCRFWRGKFSTSKRISKEIGHNSTKTNKVKHDFTKKKYLSEKLTCLHKKGGHFTNKFHLPTFNNFRGSRDQGGQNGVVGCVGCVGYVGWSMNPAFSSTSSLNRHLDLAIFQDGWFSVGFSICLKFTRLEIYKKHIPSRKN